MRVTFNSFPDTLLGRLQSLGSEQNKALTQLSTGQRIAAPSDDAPAMQRILNLRTEKKQNQQFYRNATDGLDRSKVTFSSLEQLKDLLVRSSELAANLSGASSGQEYKAKASEIDQLIQQGVNLGNTKLRGSYLFSGQTTETKPFTTNLDPSGKISSVAYEGSDEEAKIHLGEGESMTISVSSQPQENGAISGILNEMIRLRDAMLESKPSIDKVMNLRTGSQLAGSFAAGQTPDLKEGDKLVISGKTYFVSNISSAAPSNNNVFSLELSETPGGKAALKWSDPAQPPVLGGPTNIVAGTTFQRVGGLQQMEDTVLSALSRQGTVQYRLETAMKDLETRYEATEQLISKDADIDFAEATVRLNRAQMAQQAAIQSGAMIQRNSLLDYIR